jgi:NAD(P)-dependent dehydrogenase (short-subunit alcohol dehydrogenase family)
MQSGGFSQFFNAEAEASRSTRDAAREAMCCLITGVASGLGLATARVLVHEGIGVIGCDRSADALDQLAVELGSRFRPVACDVSCPQSMEEASRAVEAMQPDGLDALIHFAGLQASGPLMDLSESEFALVLNVNVIGVWRAQKAFFQLLRARRGRTILISSEVARARFCHAFSGAYALSKVCLDEFATVLRQEYGCLQPPMDVSVLHLGMFATPMLGRAASSFALAAEKYPNSPFAPALLGGDKLVRWYTRDGAALQHSARYSPERVALKVLDVLDARSPRKRYAMNVSWLMGLVSLIPSGLFDLVVVAMMRSQMYGWGKALKELLTTVITAIMLL